jgi:acyl dehydratase
MDYETLRHWPIADVDLDLTARDTMLYALGLGMGADPMDAHQLRFVYEDGLLALPTLAVVLCQPMGWTGDPKTGIDRTKVVHGEQGFTLHRPLPVSGRLRGQTRVVEVVDKGEGRGALILTETRILDRTTGECIATTESTSFARANGGFGGPSASPKVPRSLPEGRAADLADEWPVLPQLALIYRLSGDYNPLHADPGFAARAGYPQPILHGRATFGIAGIALLRQLCGWDPSRLTAMEARFSSPVFPGETIRTEIWRGDGEAWFRCIVPSRGAVVLNNGWAKIGLRRVVPTT